MSQNTERPSRPLHIHFGNRMLEDAARDVADVVRRAERGEAVVPQCHLSFEGWGALTQALRVAGLDEQASAIVITALKGMAGEDEFPFEAPDGGTSPAPWDRSALANLRRKWLHDHALGGRTIAGQQVAGDLASIVPALEAACDEVDRLRQRAEDLSESGGFFASPDIAFPERGQPARSDERDSLLDMLRQDGAEEIGDLEVFAPVGDDRDVLLREIQPLRQDCADAYQVVGALGAAAGILGSDQLAKALDNLAAASRGEARPHDKLLPFTVPDD